MKQDYQTTMSKCILMRAAIAKYDGKADGDDVESLAWSFIGAAAGVDVSVPYDQGSAAGWKMDIDPAGHF